MDLLFSHPFFLIFFSPEETGIISVKVDDVFVLLSCFVFCIECACSFFFLFLYPPPSPPPPSNFDVPSEQISLGKLAATEPSAPSLLVKR